MDNQAIKNKRPRIERVCESCGSNFLARATNVTAGKGRFCSQRCHASNQGRSVSSKRWMPALNVSMKKEADRIYLNARRRGDLKMAKYCEDCQSKDATCGHHDDYAKPLSVSWLCGSCHLARHMGRLKKMEWILSGA